MLLSDYLPKFTSQVKELIIINLPDWKEEIVRNQIKSFFTTLAIFSSWMADTANADGFLVLCYTEAKERYKDFSFPSFKEFENEMYEFLV